jgi:cell division protein FtsQ
MPIMREKKTRSRSSRKLLVLLFLFFITLLTILFFNSSISRISFIEIVGNRHLSSQEIGQASGIRTGDHFFASRAKTIENRLMKLNIVKSVKVRKNFPGHIVIEVNEYPEVAFMISSKNEMVALLANGASVEVDKGMMIDRPILTGWGEKDPKKAELCRNLGEIPPELLADISEIKPDPTAAYPDKIKLYTRSQFEVSTTVSLLPEKIEYMRYIIAEKEPGFIIMLEADHHSPY